MRKWTLVWVAAAFIVVGAAVSVFFLTRLPNDLHTQRRTFSPVLKPAKIKNRTFFFDPPFFFMRLDAKQPFFDWTCVQPVRGYLEVEFSFALVQGAGLTFSVAQYGEETRKRRLVHETVLATAGQLVRRRFRVGVALPAGSRLRFEVQPKTSAPWPAGDIGISVPCIVTRSQAAGPANVLIISIDALRSDAVGVYRELAGDKPRRSPSPEIDRFAREATVFLNARTTQSSTWPALASLLLSRYPKAHGVTSNGDYLSRRFDSIANALLQRGYMTASLLSNAFELNIPGFEEKWMCADDARLASLSAERIAAHAGAPFFHWYHLWGVHAAYMPPKWAMERLEGRKLGDDFTFYDLDEIMRSQPPTNPQVIDEVRGYYAGALLYSDSLLSRIFADLKRRGLWERTLVIVTADHGEELFDHNRYFYHHPSLYDAAIKVPLLIKFPGQRRQRLVTEGVSLVDIFPTLYDYFIDKPEPGHFSGLSLLDLLKGHDKPFRERVLLAEAEESRIVAAFSGSKKLVFNPQGLTPLTQLGLPFPIAKLELFDLAVDPGEQHRLGPSSERSFYPLLQAAEEFLRAKAVRPLPGIGEQVEIRDEIRKQAEEKLRTLGYIR
jgi:arylsulfatase A-like enzyme